MNKIVKIIKKNKKVYNICLWIFVYIKAIHFTVFMKLFSIFPIKNNRILFVSYYGKGYGDNGKYIGNELLKNKDKYELIWAAKKKFKNSIPEGIKYIKYNSLKYLYYLATSKIWINNSRFFFGMRKRKNQYYIQTWHSSLRLKRIEKDSEEYLSKQYIKSAKWDSKMCDVIISGCGFSTNIYKESFWYDGTVIETGTPRCDLFFNKNDEIIKNVYNYFNIEGQKRIILFAPTFRGKNLESNNFFNYQKFIKELNQKDDNYVLFVRFHPNSNAVLENSKNIYNATNYPDMQELIFASEMLITDYSGCCFDAMIAGKSCVIFAKDLDEYLKKERNLYFDFNILPFTIVKEEDKLVNEILEFDYDKYFDKVKEFDKIIESKETGQASKNIEEIIERMINNEKI